MKTIPTIYSVILLVFLMSFSSCNDASENPDVIQLLVNSSAEAGNATPSKWWSNNGGYSIEWSNDHSFTGDKSLMISLY